MHRCIEVFARYPGLCRSHIGWVRPRAFSTPPRAILFPLLTPSSASSDGYLRGHNPARKLTRCRLQASGDHGLPLSSSLEPTFDEGKPCRARSLDLAEEWRWKGGSLGAPADARGESITSAEGDAPLPPPPSALRNLVHAAHLDRCHAIHCISLMVAVLGDEETYTILENVVRRTKSRGSSPLPSMHERIGMHDFCDDIACRCGGQVLRGPRRGHVARLIAAGRWVASRSRRWLAPGSAGTRRRAVVRFRWAPAACSHSLASGCSARHAEPIAPLALPSIVPLFSFSSSLQRLVQSDGFAVVMSALKPRRPSGRVSVDPQAPANEAVLRGPRATEESTCSRPPDDMPRAASVEVGVGAEDVSLPGGSARKSPPVAARIEGCADAVAEPSPTEDLACIRRDDEDASSVGLDPGAYSEGLGVWDPAGIECSAAEDALLAEDWIGVADALSLQVV